MFSCSKNRIIDSLYSLIIGLAHIDVLDHVPTHPVPVYWFGTHDPTHLVPTLSVQYWRSYLSSTNIINLVLVFLSDTHVLVSYLCILWSTTQKQLPVFLLTHVHLSTYAHMEPTTMVQYLRSSITNHNDPPPTTTIRHFCSSGTCDPTFVLIQYHQHWLCYSSNRPYFLGSVVERIVFDEAEEIFGQRHHLVTTNWDMVPPHTLGVMRIKLNM